ncbi:hypothetical protein KQI42_02960 [Tissierella sp. MSJ-40]|uniref:Uncharacterized protein n=1 Tax=Tissierella simiarum TaxID=2841534 RepID=A0ABS6E220_9FIRM|nr:hypothetical protein [Tissierella simiarum]MBU5436952.1 hypothetical protein [Tissierella simiarum]
MDDKTFELLEKMYSEFLSFKNEMTGFKERSERFQDEMTEFKNDMTEFRTDMTEFKSEMTEFKSDMTKFKDDTTSRLTRIEMNQESMEKDIKTIIEVQVNHMEQNEKQHKEMMDTFDGKIEVMEAAIRHIAGQTTMNTAELTTLKKKLA